MKHAKTPLCHRFDNLPLPGQQHPTNCYSLPASLTPTKSSHAAGEGQPRLFPATRASHGPVEIVSFAQVLKRDLNTLVVELLIVATKLLATARRAIEELGDLADGSICISFDVSGTPKVD